MSNVKTYFVSFVKPGGKRGLHPVSVDKLSGMDVHKGRDVEQALSIAKDLGLDVTGDVHTSDEINDAFNHISNSEEVSRDVVGNVYGALISRKGSDPGLSEEGKKFFGAKVEHDLEVISSSVNSFFYNVLPTNKATIFISMLGMTRPSFYKMIRGVGVLGEKVNFEGFVKVLAAMGILSDVAKIISDRAEQLESSKSSMLADGLIQETQKSRKPKNL